MSAWRIPKWKRTEYRFKAGDVVFVRGFVETSPDARRQVAETWARREGYVCLGPADGSEKDAR